MCIGKKRSVIVGGGLAGVVAALWCRHAMPSGEIVILERNDSLCAGLKRFGQGPVVLGNLEETVTEGEFGGGMLPRLLMERWPGELNHAWLEGLGCRLWVEKDGAFGACSAAELKAVLEQAVAGARIEVKAGFSVESMSPGDLAHLVWSRDGQREDGSGLLIATGGEGRHMLKVMAESGHSINEVGPGFLRLKPASRSFVQALSPWQGRVVLWHPTTSDSAAGDLILSGRGLEGSAVSGLSYKLARRWREIGYRARVEIDFLPAMRESEARDAIWEMVARSKRRPIGELCPFGFTERFWRGLLTMSKGDPGEAAHLVKQRRAEALAHRIKRFPVAIEGMGMPSGDRASYGGIDPFDVYPERLESRLLRHHYFAGEVLDFLGSPRGGHMNLIFASAYLAGTALGSQ
jgi:predicted Rossmann fold flavoprotein